MNVRNGVVCGWAAFLPASRQTALGRLDPLGGKANATLALEMLIAHKGQDLSFEFHARDGRVITVTFANRHLLTSDNFAATLGLTD